MKPEKEIFDLCDIVRQTAFELQKYLRHGYLEKIYENGLANRLRKKGIDVEQQKPIQVLDEDGTELGEYFADLVIEGCLIVELKAVRDLAPEHTAQILGYLRGSRMEHGLLINFGRPKLGVKKLVLSEI
ncbi:MAG: GxxExxY protein [Kiritimatiellales bacterium]